MVPPDQYQDPVLDWIDATMQANPNAIYKKDRILALPPQCLRLVTDDGFPCDIARRHPEQSPAADAPIHARAEYDLCDDAQIAVPLSLFGIARALNVSVSRGSAADPLWRVFALNHRDFAETAADEPRSLPSGDLLSDDQQTKLLQMLQRATVIDPKNTADMTAWKAAKNKELDAMLDVANAAGSYDFGYNDSL